MILLALDTSGGSGSWAIAEIKAAAVTQLKSATWEKKAIHSEMATQKLQELLATTPWSLHQVTHLIVNLGPGSFTGIRVGYNVMRSLAYALNIPVAGVNGLLLNAYVQRIVDGTLLIAQPAIQDYFYVAGFQCSERELITRLDPQSLSREAIEPLKKTYTKVVQDPVGPAQTLITSACDLIEFHVWSPEATAFSSWQELKPVYIRASEAEEKLKKGLLKPLM